MPAISPSRRRPSSRTPWTRSPAMSSSWAIIISRLQVFADVPDRGLDAAGGGRLKALNDHIALARSFLADTGMLVAREDLALEAAFWAQLPGNFAVRPRKAPITSRNFAAMAPFHNYPVGRATGNHWGEALSMFVTSARSPYHFSLHASDPKRSRRRKPQRHRAYAHLRAHRLGQDGVHRLSDRHAGSPGCDSSHLRQGSRT